MTLTLGGYHFRRVSAAASAQRPEARHPGIGCAGRGIITAFEQLEQLQAYDHYQPDIVHL